jgi:uncharacterized protein with HEPN domain
MTNETRQRLLDDLRSCHAVADYTVGLDYAAYQRDDMLRDAVECRLGIIGEALHRAQLSDPTLAVAIPELHQVVGLRNRIIHGYSKVDDAIVWDAVTTKVPNLQSVFEALLAKDAEVP